MAVEASNTPLFPPHIHPNREMIDQGNGKRIAYGKAPGKSKPEAVIIPMYGSGITDSFAPVAFQADSGHTCNVPVSRKRSRDSSSNNLPNATFVNRTAFTFLGKDISAQIYQQQMEIDCFIVHHTEKVRTEIDEMRRRNLRRLIAAAEEGIDKKLRAKEEEIVKIRKLNWALEEKVKSLSVENQIWKELAQSNEATANALQSNLEQVLAQVQLQQQRLDFADNVATALIDDAQSYCGSNHEEDQRQQDTVGQRKVNNPYRNNDEDYYCTTTSANRLNRCCRNCGKEESCVLLLPCRHLCVCTVCASSIIICPVCKSTKSGVVQINVS